MDDVHFLAQITNPVLPTTLGSGGPEVGARVLGSLISSLIGLIIITAFVLSFFFLLIGGLQWALSSGDKANLEGARNKIIHALMGLLIVGATWAIMTLVGQFFGFNFTSDVFRFTIPSLQNTLNSVGRAGGGTKK